MRAAEWRGGWVPVEDRIGAERSENAARDKARLGEPGLGG